MSLQCIDVVQASIPQTPCIEPYRRVHFPKDRFVALVFLILECRLTPDKQTCLPLLHSVRLALGPGAGQVALIPLYVVKETTSIQHTKVKCYIAHWEMQWFNDQCAGLWIEQSGFEPWHRSLCCIIGQDNFTLTVPLSTQVYINGYQRTKRGGGRGGGGGTRG